MSPRVKSDRRASLSRFPKPDELAHNPELALLHALDNILELVPRVLVTAHPELGEPEAPFWVREASRTTRSAGDILRIAHRLRRILRAYRAAITIARDQRLEADPDIPF